MDLEGIIREMQERPDAQFLLEWLHQQDQLDDDLRSALDAYFDAVEEL